MVPFITGRCSGDRGKAETREEKCESPLMATASFAYANGDILPRRKPGEPLIPLIRGDVNYRSLEDGQYAVDLRAEGGYGPFALQVSDSQCHLDGGTREIVEGMGSLRMSIAEHAEIDACFGSLDISGDGQPAAFAWGVPVLIHPYKRPYGVEFRPVFSNRLTDLDIAAFAHYHAVSVKAGYRAQYKDETSFAGPYLGVTARY